MNRGVSSPTSPKSKYIGLVFERCAWIHGLNVSNRTSLWLTTASGYVSSCSGQKSVFRWRIKWFHAQERRCSFFFWREEERKFQIMSFWREIEIWLRVKIKRVWHRGRVSVRDAIKFSSSRILHTFWTSSFSRLLISWLTVTRTLIDPNKITLEIPSSY